MPSLDFRREYWLQTCNLPLASLASHYFSMPGCLGGIRLGLGAANCLDPKHVLCRLSIPTAKFGNYGATFARRNSGTATIGEQNSGTAGRHLGTEERQFGNPAMTIWPRLDNSEARNPRLPRSPPGSRPRHDDHEFFLLLLPLSPPVCLNPSRAIQVLTTLI